MKKQTTKKWSQQEYPSKTQILKNLPTADKQITELLRNWMTNTWQIVKEKGEEEKFFALRALIKTIAKMKNSPVDVKYRPSIPYCCYYPQEKTIYLNNSLSIISSLHELGHHLLGDSELKACRWSVSLFKDAFPKSYSKLNWKGHLLIKGTK